MFICIANLDLVLYCVGGVGFANLQLKASGRNRLGTGATGKIDSNSLHAGWIEWSVVDKPKSRISST